MTPAISAGDLSLLRSRPHTMEWFLAVAPYGTATFTARVDDGGAARGDMAIIYDTDVGEGTVLSGMTLWVGSTAGAYDMGKVRIRSINTGANTLNVAENDDIEWTDDLHLTCPGNEGFFEIWGRYQRITEAGGVVTFYEDFDDTFTAPADTVLPPKANAGPPVCAWINSTLGYVDVSFVGDRSFTTEIGAALATYLWDFSDGAIQVGTVNTMGSCAAPVVVRFSTPGFRYISLTVTDDTAQARTHIVRVPVWIFEEGVEDPYTMAEIKEQSCTPSSGWTCRLKVFQTDTVAEDIIYNFPDGALVVLFTKTTYGGTEDDVGGFCFRENIRFVGWIEQETLRFDFDAGTVDFDAISHDGILRRLPGFPFTLELVTVAATDWYEMENLNVDRALMYLLRYHTTATLVCHVEIPGEANTRDIAIQPFTDGSIYNQAQEDLLADARCLLLSDRQGVLRATRDPQFMDAGDRVGVGVVCTLLQTNPNNQADWMNTLDEIHPHTPPVGMVRLGGFSGTTPLLSQAPGDAPRQQQAVMSLDGMILQDQAEANLWSGLALTKANSPFPKVPIELSGNWPVFDPAWQEYVKLTTTDALGRNVWTAETFVVREVQFRSHPTANASVTRLMLEIENEILSGETQVVPVAPPPEPPLPPPPPIPPPLPPLPDLPIKAAVNVIWFKIGYTNDLLRNHVNSIATAGTGGFALFDTTVDFVSIGVAIGDVVEDLTTHAHTTVTAVVGANQLTLNANIGLAAASTYHVAGLQWVDIQGIMTGAIIQFKYVQTGPSTCGAWCLTTDAAYWTANILTPSPTWTEMITITTIRAAVGYVDFRCAMRGMAVWTLNPAYMIINFSMRDRGAGNTRGCVFTSNTGAAWVYSTFPASIFNNKASYHGITVDQLTGAVFVIRGQNSFPGMYVWRSVDNGANFARGTNIVANWPHDDSVAELLRPYSVGTSQLFVQVRESSTAPGVSADNGDNWALLTTPVGYQILLDLGGFTVRGGLTGWYGDANDILCSNYELIAGTVRVLMRSRDGGGTWTQIANEEALFNGMPVGWLASDPIALPPSIWPPDEDVMILSSWAASGLGAVHTQRRLFYTDDNGTTWMNKMGNWYAVFTTWPSGTREGTGVCVGLPRIGNNA